jgi:DNA-binding response OmpR family regulator
MREDILVVDDEAPVRKIMETCLSYAGYRVTSAPDGRSALQAITREQPDLVLLDVRMPDLSGWDLLSLLRRSQRHRDLPVIMLTGMSDAASQAHGWRLDCTSYLTKPMDLNDLLLLVKRVLHADAPPPKAMDPATARGALNLRSACLSADSTACLCPTPSHRPSLVCEPARAGWRRVARFPNKATSSISLSVPPEG